MLASIMNWIKVKLLLHVPLWVCGLLFFGAFLMPKEWQGEFIIALTITYVVFRYVWRRHLKKQGKLGDVSTGLFSLLFWALVGIALLYSWLSPHPPELAVYTNGEAPNGKHEDDIHLGKHGGKRSFLHIAAESLEEAENAMQACLYAKQEKLLTDCAETKDFPLDNNPETLEVLVLAGDPYACDRQDCRVWLIQITAEQLAAREEHSEKVPDTKPPEVQANLVASWDQVVPPIQIGAENPSGWRKLQISHKNGDVEEWQQDIPQ
jgi:hypothetical protein